MAYTAPADPSIDLAVDEQIIRRNAGLAAVEQLAEDQSLCREIELCCGVHDTGALAAQFHRDRCEMLCGAVHQPEIYGFSPAAPVYDEYLLRGFEKNPSGISKPALIWMR